MNAFDIVHLSEKVWRNIGLGHFNWFLLEILQHPKLREIILLFVAALNIKITKKKKLSASYFFSYVFKLKYFLVLYVFMVFLIFGTP